MVKGLVVMEDANQRSQDLSLVCLCLKVRPAASAVCKTRSDTHVTSSTGAL